MPHPQAILVIGTDRYLIEEKVNALIREILPHAEKGDFSVETIHAAVDKADDAVGALQQARQAFVQTSFFATDKIVWLRNLSFSGATDRVSKSQTVRDAIEEFRTDLREHGLPEGVTLLITSTVLAKNSALFKTFQGMQKSGKAEIFDVGGGDPNSARKLVARFAAEQGWTIGAESVQAMVDRCGTDGNTLRNECAKLFAYTAGKEPLPEDVAAICTLHHDGEAWDLADAFGMHDLPGSIRILHTLLSLKAAPIMLVIVLEGRIDDLALLADARERGLLAPGNGQWASGLSDEDRAAIADLGAMDPLLRPGFTKGRLVSQSLRWTRAKAVAARMALYRCHEQLVTSPADPETLLELAISEALS